jgi:predicted Zn finger-like uncharacterized protein
MDVQDPHAAGERSELPTAARRAKKAGLRAHLDRNVNPNVSPDNIWEKRVSRPGAAGQADRWKVKISCPSCAAKYSIADEKVQDKLAKIRCRKCGTTIVIDGKVSPPSVYAGDASASQAEQPQASNPNAGIAPGEYSVDLGDNDQRTMTMDALVESYNTGVVTAETYVWTEGMDDWLPLGQVPAIVDALHAASNPAAAAPMPEPAPAEPPVSAAINSSEIASQGPWEQSASMESASAIRAAAKPGGGRGSTADLFGSFESAGSEADVSTSAPRATPAPTPAPAQQSSASAPAAAGSGGTGARNESSVLFSLSALTASAGSVSPTTASSTTATSSGSGTATKEDSGLIDLKALTAAADAPAAAPIAPLTPSPLGMAPPLGLAPPLGGGVEAQIAMPTAMPQKSRTGLFIGGGIAVAALLIAGAIVATSSKPEPPPAPTVAATAPPPPTATAAPTKTEEETTAKPPATGTADEDEKKNPPKVAGGTKRPTTKTSGGSTTKSSGGTTSGGTTSKPAATSKPATKSSGGCGCAPGDLQCAMRCAAKGG